MEKLTLNEKLIKLEKIKEYLSKTRKLTDIEVDRFIESVIAYQYLSNQFKKYICESKKQQSKDEIIDEIGFFLSEDQYIENTVGDVDKIITIMKELETYPIMYTSSFSEWYSYDPSKDEYTTDINDNTRNYLPRPFDQYYSLPANFNFKKTKTFFTLVYLFDDFDNLIEKVINKNKIKELVSLDIPNEILEINNFNRSLNFDSKLLEEEIGSFYKENKILYKLIN